MNENKGECIWSLLTRNIAIFKKEHADFKGWCLEQIKLLFKCIRLAREEAKEIQDKPPVKYYNCCNSNWLVDSCLTYEVLRQLTEILKQLDYEKLVNRNDAETYLSGIDTKCHLINNHFLVWKHARGCNNNAASGFSTPVGEVPCSFSMERALMFSSSKKEELFSSSEVQMYPNFFALGIQMEICSVNVPKCPTS